MTPVDEPTWKLRLPRKPSAPPAVAILRRVAIAITIVLLNWGLVVIERDGYNDAADGDPEAAALRAGDRIIYVTTQRTE